MNAYYHNQTGLPLGTDLDHLMLKFFQTANADTTADLEYQMRKYYSTQAGVSGTSLDDAQAAFFLSGGSHPTSGFGADPFGALGFGD